MREQFRANAGTIALGSAFVLLGSGFALAWPWVLRNAIDDLTAGVAAPLALYASLIVLLAGGEAVSRFLMRSTIIGMSREIEYRLRNQLFSHYLMLEAAFYHRMRTGDLMARSTNDLNAVRQLFGPGILNSLNTVVMATAALGLMFTIDARLAAYTAVILPTLSVIYVVFKRRIEQRFRAVQEQFGALSNQAQENFAGVRVVKAYAQEQAEVADFSRVSEEYAHRYLKQIQISGLLWPLMSLVSGLAVVLLIYVGGLEVVAGRLSLGQFVQFYAYLGMLSWPMIALGWVFTLVQQGAASVKRIEEILERSPAIADPAHERLGATSRGSIDFQNVSLTIDGTRVLEDISLSIPGGATVAFVGAVGSGKSSLASLLPRVFDPTAGRVLLDGVDLREMGLSRLRQLIGYVPQDTFLFSTTLRENIALGVEECDAEQLESAVQISQLAKDLDQLPQGLETVIGERGVTLSGGQKQRTALARALLKDPAILILDDALSSVDAATEAAILTGLRDYMRTRTSLIVSHRISAVKDADEIVVLDRGRIAEQGTHDELIRRGGLYRDMYRRQLLQAELSQNLGAQNDAADGLDGSNNHGHNSATQVSLDAQR